MCTSAKKIMFLTPISTRGGDQGPPNVFVRNCMKCAALQRGNMFLILNNMGVGVKGWAQDSKDDLLGIA